MIRYLEDHEKLNIIPLYDKCFDDSPEYKKYYFEEVLPENHIAVSEENGQIRGMLHLIPKSVTIGKLRNHCFYIYGVATEPDCRNNGIMTGLMESVLKDLHENMECFTYLIPSSPEKAGLYEKCGFSYVYDKQELKSEELRRRPTHSLVLRKADHADLARLAIFAESTMEDRYGIFLSKDREYFKNMFSLMNAEGGKIDLYFENKIVLGYRIGFEDEMIEEVLDDSIMSMSWEGTEKSPYAMARILNIKKMLRMIGTRDSGRIVISIKDNVIEDNDGTFLWEFDHSQSSWNRTDQKPEMELSIGEFTAHLFGYIHIPGLPEMNVKNGFFINDYI